MDTQSPEPPKKQAKRFFDIQPPSHYPPSPTSRPVIVSNKPPIPDPMVVKKNAANPLAKPPTAAEDARTSSLPAPTPEPLPEASTDTPANDPVLEQPPKPPAVEQPLIVSEIAATSPLPVPEVSSQPVVVHHRLQKSRSAVRLFFFVIGFLLLLTVLLGLLLNAGVLPPFIHLPYVK